MRRYFGIPAVGGLVLSLALAGCTGSAPGTLSAILGDDIAELLEQIDNVVVIRVLNRTNDNIAFDVLIDGLEQTIDCLALVGICDFPLTDCPMTIEAVAMRRIDARGGFAGGFFFHGAEDFIFTAEEDFQCGQFIIFEFEEDGASASVM